MSFVFILALAGCGGGNDDGDAGGGVDAGGTTDGGGTTTDGGGTTTDGGGTITDGGGTTTDGGGTTTDGGGTTADGGGTTTDGGSAECAGMECADYAAVLADAARDATAISNCVIQLHQLDCCGAMAAYGINHGARTALCAAEDACTATYPADPGCTDMTITTDSGETTTDMDNVKLRLTDDGTCETFVCTTDACGGAPGIMGGCAP